ncbi:hypothetical protein O1M54_10260 [Streptomyces diastatochromogenes]|nr:hypothetical protein [Streptomyces diastatochromogenes]
MSAHHLTSVVVTVDAARRLKDSRPELAAEALSFAERTGIETVAALQRLVGLLRDTDRPGPEATSAEIEELVAGFGRLGRPVAAHLPDDLTGPVAEAIHGIVREALTNALRHAPGAAARVLVRRENGVLELTVENAPPRTSAPHDAGGLGAGRGVAGMRERAASAGGELTAGPSPDGGWLVRATLPDTAGPRQPPRPVWRRDILREQRLADPALALTAMVLPVVTALAATEDWSERTRRDSVPELIAVTVLLVLHALPLVWRRRAPLASYAAVLATAWLWPVTVAVLPLPSRVSQFLVMGTFVELLAVYAVAAYGQGPSRTWPAAIAGTFSTASVVTATAAADGSFEGDPIGGLTVVMVVVLGVLLAPSSPPCAAPAYRRTTPTPAPSGERRLRARPLDVACGAGRRGRTAPAGGHVARGRTAPHGLARRTGPAGKARRRGRHGQGGPRRHAGHAAQPRRRRGP